MAEPKLVRQKHTSKTDTVDDGDPRRDFMTSLPHQPSDVMGFQGVTYTSIMEAKSGRLPTHNTAPRERKFAEVVNDISNY